ncbi:MAG TPA: vWA domain-containing protein [Pyrinomonadaceae bacterium]
MKDATHISVLLDRSGSMGLVKDETISGFNYFLKEQQAAGDNATFTLVQFDSESTDVVHEARQIREVPALNQDTYLPRGSTPLLDALGQTILSTGKTLAGIPEPNRPDKVVFVVITDGEENASHQFTKARVKEMIDHQTAKYNWKFIYLGANQDAFAEAGGVGIAMAHAANFTPAQTKVAFMGTSANVASYRRSGRSEALQYSEEQRQRMVKPEGTKEKEN